MSTFAFRLSSSNGVRTRRSADTAIHSATLFVIAAATALYFPYQRSWISAQESPGDQIRMPRPLIVAAKTWPEFETRYPPNTKGLARATTTVLDDQTIPAARVDDPLLAHHTDPQAIPFGRAAVSFTNMRPDFVAESGADPLPWTSLPDLMTVLEIRQ